MNDWYQAERRVERAQELLQRRQLQEALEELRAAVAVNPHNSAWLFNIGLILDELSRRQEAIQAYRQALEVEGDDVQTLHRLGVDLHVVGRYDEALEVLRQIEALDRTFEPCYCQRILT
jgi:superkiller protein 3